MSGVDVSIALPENETPGELIKGYFTLMRAFGWDLYVTSHFTLRESLGSQWFAARISELKGSDPKNWRPNHRFEPQDPGVILRDYIHEQDSPYLSVFGGQFQKQTAAKKILATRNTWFHFGDDPTTAQLEEAAKVVRGFVQSSDMHIAGRIDALIERLSDLRTGRYPAEAAPSAPATVPVVAEPAPLDAPEDLPRPSIGGTWVGPIPGLRYHMTRAGAVVHPDTMESVRSRVTGDFADKVRAWTASPARVTGSKRHCPTALSTKDASEASTLSLWSRLNASTWPSRPISITPLSVMLASACARTSRALPASVAAIVAAPVPSTSAMARKTEDRIAPAPSG